MQLKREIKFETLRKSHKKQIIIGSVLVCVVGSILTFNLTKAKYRLTQSMKLVTGTINYKVPDMRVVALYTENDNNEYVESDDVPTSGYTLNEEKSLCRVYDGTTSVAEAPIDTKATITYHDGVIGFDNISKKNTRCYLYFDLIEDSEKPIITNVTTSSTENSITVNVSATDNIGVNKYYYQIDSEEVIEKPESSHTFTGLVLGSSHTIKVYVKDGRGNTSEVTTKTVSTVGTSETTLAKLGITGVKDTTPTFGTTATKAENADANNGIFRTDDGMYGGKSVYWRGAATTNHVIFANKCWRIVRINGDGSIRLIYNGAVQSNNTCTGNGKNSASIVLNSEFNKKDNSASYMGWTYKLGFQRPNGVSEGIEMDSNAKTELENWFEENITGIFIDKITDGKFCNDRKTRNNDDWLEKGSVQQYYEVGDRLLYSPIQPTYSCSNADIYLLKVGLITGDELTFAGSMMGGSSVHNEFFYLYNGQNYWTMSPFYWNGGDSEDFGFYGSSTGIYLAENGAIGQWYLSTSYGIRPVINLRSDVTFNSGSDGTQNNPYIVQ